MEPITWFVLGYQVPASPSKKRVYIWRKLKEIGATYFRPGVALLPKSTASLKQFQFLANKITEMDGESTLGEMRYLDPKDEERMVAEFRLQSKTEYQKLIKEIQQLHKAYEKDPNSAPQIEDKIRRLGKKLADVKARDYFMSRREPAVSSPMEELLRDMSTATLQLREHINSVITGE